MVAILFSKQGQNDSQASFPSHLHIVQHFKILEHSNDFQTIAMAAMFF